MDSLPCIPQTIVSSVGGVFGLDKSASIGYVALIWLVGCVADWHERASLPQRNTVVRGQLVFHSDFPLPANHRLLEELTALRVDLEERLGLPPTDEPIEVYLFEGAELFREFMRRSHPEFPSRRAFFLKTDTRLLVYAQWGDRIAEDLRHEVTHGYLHSAIANVPLWLDEGLAEYAEAPRGHHGVNRDHLRFLGEQIGINAWQPDLGKLERLSTSADLTQAQYAEAWAWVHFLLETQPERAAILREYLTDLRQRGAADPISDRLARLEPDPARSLVEHVVGLYNSQ